MSKLFFSRHVDFILSLYFSFIYHIKSCSTPESIGILSSGDIDKDGTLTSIIGSLVAIICKYSSMFPLSR